MVEQQNHKFCKIDHRIWWVIFISLQTFLIAVMIGTLSTKSWIELNPTPTLTMDLNFKGSLIYVEEGLERVPNIVNQLNPFDLKNYTYQRVACGACFIVDLLHKETTPEPFWSLYNSWCKMFRRLWFGAGLFIVFEILALICLAIMIVLMILFIYNRFYFRASYYAGGCMWASHYVAILGWIGVANVTFNDDCHEIYDGTNPPKLCAKQAPALALFALIFIPFVMVPFFILVKKLSLKHNLTPVSITSEREENANNFTQMSHPSNKKQEED